MNWELLDKQTTYIVGVSGGVDSMALLDMLVEKQYQVVACHVNYHFRQDSDIDQKNVVDYCHAHCVDCHVYEANPDDFGKENFQHQARAVRYHFYETIGTNYQTDKVILGHHYDDVLENIVMQQQRGNCYNYQGIRSKTKIFGLEVIRPLLDTKKESLYAYCKKRNVTYHEDYTNFQTHFTRDKIRNEVIPQLTKEQKETIMLQATILNQDILKKEAQIAPYYQQFKENEIIDYTQIETELLPVFLYAILKDVIHPPKISKTLIDEIIKQIQSEKPNIEVKVSVNVLFIKEYNNISILAKNQQLDYCLKYDKIVYAREEMFFLEAIGHIDEGVCIEESDFPITIRNAHPGDRMITSGGTKRLSRLFIDRKIPKKMRRIWPVVVRNDGTIILVPRIAKNINYLYTKPNVYVVKLDH